MALEKNKSLVKIISRPEQVNQCPMETWQKTTSFFQNEHLNVASVAAWPNQIS